MTTRREAGTAWLQHSPFVQALGIRVEELGDDAATLTLPYRDDLPTMGDTVHGGALSTLADTAIAAAVWASDEPLPESPAGATVSLHVDFVAAARGQDVVARATVLKRGRRTSFVRAELHAGDRLVAVASGVYAT